MYGGRNGSLQCVEEGMLVDSVLREGCQSTEDERSDASWQFMKGGMPVYSVWREGCQSTVDEGRDASQ